MLFVTWVQECSCFIFLYVFISGCGLYSYLNSSCFFSGKSVGLSWEVPQEDSANCSNCYTGEPDGQSRILGQSVISEKHVSQNLGI